MSVYDNVASTKTSNKTPFFSPGRYRVRVEAFKSIVSQQGGATYTIHECEVLESRATDAHIPPNMPGTKASQAINTPGKNNMGLADIKKMVFAALSATLVNAGHSPIKIMDDPAEDEQTARIAIRACTGRDLTLGQFCEMIYSNEEILEGIELDLECVHVKTKANGVFTRHDWHAPGAFFK